MNQSERDEILKTVYVKDFNKDELARAMQIIHEELK